MRNYRWISPNGTPIVMSEEKIEEMVERWQGDHMLAVWWSLPRYLQMSEEDYSVWITKPSKFLVEE